MINSKGVFNRSNVISQCSWIRYRVESLSVSASLMPVVIGLKLVSTYIVVSVFSNQAPQEPFMPNATLVIFFVKLFFLFLDQIYQN